MKSIQSGLRFKTRSGLVVETTGATLHVESTKVFVHEVVDAILSYREGSKILDDVTVMVLKRK